MVLISNKLYKWGDIYFLKPDLLLSPYPYNPWDERYIYLLIDPIKINHSWIGKYTMPTDCMGIRSFILRYPPIFYGENLQFMKPSSNKSDGCTRSTYCVWDTWPPRI